jgi:PAS domain S-box-containing protein
MHSRGRKRFALPISIEGAMADSTEKMTKKTTSRTKKAAIAKKKGVVKKPVPRNGGLGPDVKLREAEFLYHSLFNQSPDGILVIDMRGRFVDFNEAAHRQLGYTRDEFAGLRLSDIDPFQSRGEIEASIKKVIQCGSDDFEVRHRTKHGEIRDVRVITQLMDLSGGTFFHTIWRDVTDHKRSEETLLKTNAKLEALINAIPDMVLFKDVEGRYSVVNKAVEASTGAPREAMVGKTNDELLPPELAAQCNTSDREAMGSALPIHAEELARGADGRTIFLDTIKAPIHDDKGSLIGLLAVSRDITERKKFEEDLREREEQYRAIFEGSPDAILPADPETGIILDANPAAVKLLGRRRGEIIGLHQSRLHPPREEAAVRRVFAQHYAETKEHGKTPLHEDTVIRPDGSEVPVEIVSQTITFKGKKVLQGVFRDISERKLVEKKLRESERFLETIIETEPECIKLLASDGTLLLMNRAGLAMIDAASLDQVKGQCMYPLVTPAFRREFTALTEDVFRGGSGSLEFEAIGLRGRHIWLETHAVPLRNDKNEIIALLGVTRDVTERKRAEEGLKKSEAFVKNILETVDEGFIVIDHDYRIISANKAYLDQVKLPRDEVMGRQCYNISHRLNKPCYEAGEDCAVRRTFEKGGPDIAVHTHKDEKGAPVFVEIKSYPIKDEAGNVISVIEIVNNVTEKKKLEEQLRHAQKMEAVGQLAGGIAHDFNNILTAIVGYGSLIKMRMSEDDPMRHHLQQMLDSSERAANLTRGLLAFSRKQVISPKPVDLNRIIENVEKLLRRLIGEDIELKVDLAPGNLIVMADSGHIEQILMNLATNARDAMPERGRFSISTEPVELSQNFVKVHGYGKEGPYALISVTDTGSGMDVRTRERIFEPFFTTKEPGRGTGLGLSIVYGIVKQHNGYVTCYSEPGKGTAFKIYLPVIKQESAKKETASRLPVMGGTETILIAEDDGAVRELLKKILEQFGYAVIEARDGEEALRRFKENRDRVQLLIFDVIMPKKNGKEVYDEIRKIRPGVKIIFTSGYTADILHKKGILEEDLNFVSKPVEPTELLRNVRNALDGKNRPEITPSA